MRSPSKTGPIGLDKPFMVGDWQIEPAANCVIGQDREIRLEPKAMQVLVQIAARAGQVVTREELEASVWTGMVVGPDALTNAIIKLRRAFGDSAKEPKFIETIPKTGYRLIAPVRPLDEQKSPPLERKLCAILHADVVGYSRLSGENEEATHRTLSSCLDLFSATIRANNGSVVNYAGDAILAEFTTVSEALGCAAEVQRELYRRDTSATAGPPIQFRIGINLGEVIVDRDDIYGDGVNIAARLEALAEPGGICISESAKAAVGNKLPLDYEFMGEKAVKNIAEPIRAYRVLFYPADPKTRPRLKPVRNLGTLAAVLILLIVTAGYYWLRQDALPESSRQAEQSAESPPAAAISNKPAIAVLPFANVSVNADEEYFADGMTDDIITDLSKISGLEVIARSTVFTYKNKPIKIADISRELNVRYVLEGSIRRAGVNVRINVQLVDATTGHHVWAERFDRRYQEFFALQDEVIAQVVAAVSVNLTDTEMARIARPPTANLEAYDYYLRAEQVGYIGGTEGLGDTVALYAKAIELDPEFADAYAGLARSAAEAWRQDMSDLVSGAQARDNAYKSAARALEIDPANGRAYSVLAILQLSEGHHDAAIASARKAVALTPGQAQAYLDLGLVLAMSGEAEPGLKSIETALRLNPKPTPDTLLYAGIVEFHAGNYERAVENLSRATAALKTSPIAWLYLAAAHGLLGQNAKAQQALKNLERLAVVSLQYIRAAYSYLRRAEDLQKLLDGLAQAGLPQWAFGVEKPASERLGEKELRALAIGRTWTGRHLNGVEFFQQIGTDGSLAYRSANSFQSGVGSVRSGMLCQRFDHTTLNQDLCGYIYRNAEGSAANRDEYVAVMPDSVRFFSALP